jgi:hypothetical protein
VGKSAGKPGVLLIEITLELSRHAIVASQEAPVAQNGVDPLALDRLQKLDRVVIDFFPQILVDDAVEVLRLRLPRPPQVVTELLKLLYTLRQLYLAWMSHVHICLSSLR